MTDPRLGPPVIRNQFQCSTEYQGGPGSSVTCRCGTFAIGLCAICRTPVCGVHGTMRADRRLCPAHDAELRQHEDLRSRDAAAADAAARYEAQRLWVVRTEKELAGVHSVERIVRVVASFSKIEGGYSPAQTYHDKEALDALLGGATWDDIDVSNWFLGAVRTPPPHTLVIYETTRRRRSRPKNHAGWIFRYGSTHVDEWKDATPSFGAFAILEDGRMAFGVAQPGLSWSLTPRSASERMNTHTMEIIAHVLGLRTLEPRPGSRWRQRPLQLQPWVGWYETKPLG